MLVETLATPSATLVRALLFQALNAAGAVCSLDRVGRTITRENIDAVRGIVWNAWVASMAEPQKRKPEEDEEIKKLTWIDAWAMAREHGLSDEEWLQMTPRQFRALQDARVVTYQRQEYLNGMVIASIENFSMSRPTTPSSPEKFLLHKFSGKSLSTPIGRDPRRALRWDSESGFSVN